MRRRDGRRGRAQTGDRHAPGRPGPRTDVAPARIGVMVRCIKPLNLRLESVIRGLLDLAQLRLEAGNDYDEQNPRRLRSVALTN
jgi:hypothetical protein